MSGALAHRGLPRELAGLPQRDRILWAMVRVVADEGYDGVTVAAVVARGGVSRSTFYEHFANKDECLFAAYDLVVDSLLAHVAEAYGRALEWPASIRQGLDAFLSGLAAEPDVARMAMVEVPSGGPEAYRRYRDALERFLPFFAAGRDWAPSGSELPRDLELMAVGGAEAIIFDEVASGRISRLPAMLPEIVFAVLVPYVGPERAVAEMRVAAGASVAA